MPLTGREKATIFLSILGAETSARILRYLPDELADLIASGITHLPSPSPEALTEVLRDFQSFVALPASAPTASLPNPEERARTARPRQSFTVLMYERPQMKAFLINLMTTADQGEALASLSRDKEMTQEIINNLRLNPLREKIAIRLRELYKEKLFWG
jgi:flagellar motor switch protein FliG